MRDYKRSSVYHLLDQLTIELYTVIRELPPNERSLLGYPMLQAANGATTAVIHGCLTRNPGGRLPYVERAHTLVEELGQHLRVAQRLNLIPMPEVARLSQRQQSCSRLLLQWRQTLVLNEDPLGSIDEDAEAWAVAEEPPAKANKAEKSRPGKKYPPIS